MHDAGNYSLFFFIFTSVLLIVPISYYIYYVFEGKKTWFFNFIHPIESRFYILYGMKSINAHASRSWMMTWKEYTLSILGFNTLGFFVSYFILRNQDWLPFNPQHFTGLSPELSFHIIISFMTNTDWQAYGGEQSLSYFSQLTVCTLQGFLSAGTGMAVAIALIRGLKNEFSEYIGNFWEDITKSILYILLPLSLVIALVLSQQGVIQNILPYQKVYGIEQVNLIKKNLTQDNVAPKQIIPMGPVASLVAIKNLGTNGGGYFNTNSAHPFENPTAVTNFIELLSMVIIPAALVLAFGLFVNKIKVGIMILVVMFAFFIPSALTNIATESQGIQVIPGFSTMQEHPQANMEGKEARFGTTYSAIWATLATATSTGSSNSSYESMLPISNIICMLMMGVQEVIFGGVGSGLYNMLMVIVVAILIAALMVGRSPYFLNKKLDSFDIKMATFSIILTPFLVIFNTVLMSLANQNEVTFDQYTAHGLSQILFNSLSMMNNNGSSFASMNIHSSFYLLLTGFSMLVARFWIIISVLAFAGSMSNKKLTTAEASLLKISHPVFLIFLMAVIFLIGALSYLPILSLGPVIEWIHSGV